MKICNTCGANNKDDNSICTKCGKELDAVSRYPIWEEIEIEEEEYDLEL